MARVLPTETTEQFDLWVAPYLPRMALVAARFGPAHERDDILQEALLRAWRYRSSFDPVRGSLGGWLCSITANVARGKVRKAWLRSLIQPRAVDAPDLEMKLDLEGAVTKLSGRQRLAIECYYAIGLSIEETSHVMRCSQGTVKSTLADARVTLRAHLNHSTEGISDGRS